MLLRVTFFLILFVTSCKTEDVNSDFNLRYGEEIEQMRAMKGASGSGVVSATSSVPSQFEILKSQSEYIPYAGIARFGEKSPQENIPSQETYDLSKTTSSAGLPPDVFDLNYNLTMHPPFKRIGIEFDNIRIPRTDIYGIETAISDKTYITPGGRVLQKTIDRINAYQSADDVKNSHILVAEKKKIARKRSMENVFGAYEEMKIQEGDK